MFTRRSTSPEQTQRVKAWVTERLALSETDLVSVAELACHEPDCPPVETVLTVHRTDGSRESWKIHKPLSEVAQTDVTRAVAVT